MGKETMDALDELEQSLAQLKAVAEILMTFAYEGYRAESGAVASSGQKHGMIGGGLSVKDVRVHRELQQMRDDVGRKAAELRGIAGRYYRVVFDHAPQERVTDEMLAYVDEWEKDQQRKRGRR